MTDTVIHDLWEDEYFELKNLGAIKDWGAIIIDTCPAIHKNVTIDKQIFDDWLQSKFPQTENPND
jgi:hypothetical protein